jgi:hypothetical protein
MGSIALFALAVACACSAQENQKKDTSAVLWEPPVTPWPEHLPKATVSKEMIGSLRISGMPIVLESTNLEDVRRHFGGVAGTVDEIKESRAWLCYQGSNGDRHWIVWLTSSKAEGRTKINGVQWETLGADESPDSRCVTLPKDGGGIQLPVAVYPGMKGEEARQALGEPTLTRSNLLIFFHERRKSLFRPKSMVRNTMGVALRDDIVQEIDVEKTTSN